MHDDGSQLHPQIRNSNSRNLPAQIHCPKQVIRECRSVFAINSRRQRGIDWNQTRAAEHHRYKTREIVWSRNAKQQMPSEKSIRRQRADRSLQTGRLSFVRLSEASRNEEKAALGGADRTRSDIHFGMKKTARQRFCQKKINRLHPVLIDSPAFILSQVARPLSFDPFIGGISGLNFIDSRNKQISIHTVTVSPCNVTPSI
jgi:hypothetical protein